MNDKALVVQEVQTCIFRHVDSRREMRKSRRHRNVRVTSRGVLPAGVAKSSVYKRPARPACLIKVEAERHRGVDN